MSASAGSQEIIWHENVVPFDQMPTEGRRCVLPCTGQAILRSRYCSQCVGSQRRFYTERAKYELTKTTKGELKMRYWLGQKDKEKEKEKEKFEAMVMAYMRETPRELKKTPKNISWFP